MSMSGAATCRTSMTSSASDCGLILPAGIPLTMPQMIIGGTSFAPARTQKLPPLLVIAGSDQDSRLNLDPETIRAAGSSDLHLLIDEATPYFLMHVTRNYFKQAPSRPDLLPFRTVLNLVTD